MIACMSIINVPLFLGLDLFAFSVLAREGIDVEEKIVDARWREDTAGSPHIDPSSSFRQLSYSTTTPYPILTRKND